MNITFKLLLFFFVFAHGPLQAKTAGDYTGTFKPVSVYEKIDVSLWKKISSVKHFVCFLLQDKAGCITVPMC